jgi:zinc resistance-associated protein
MWKIVLTGATALAIIGGSFAYAQQGPNQPDRRQQSRPSAEDVTAFGDARIAALHAGLKLNADQEKNWPAVESALRDLIKLRVEGFSARASANQPTNPIERLSARADMMVRRGAALKKLADAAGPLYNSLDESQKGRVVPLARFVGQFGGSESPMGRRFRGEWRQHMRGPNDGHTGSQAQ